MSPFISANAAGRVPFQCLLLERPGRSYAVVVDNDGHRMVAKKGVVEQVGPVDGRLVLQDEIFVSLSVTD